jgi:hypothetical protein
MESATLHARLQVLEAKITALLANYKHKEALVEQLQAENKQLKEQLSNDLGGGPDAPNNLPTTTFAGVSDETKRWAHTVEGYIDEVDQCIAYLEQL